MYKNISLKSKDFGQTESLYGQADLPQGKDALSRGCGVYTTIQVKCIL